MNSSELSSELDAHCLLMIICLLANCLGTRPACGIFLGAGLISAQPAPRPPLCGDGPASTRSMSGGGLIN